ncbi:hypothetical protein GOODEAATRI_003779 [Goodea atripinnis]|uniref:Uncharacterized protein n=1 Tax=Goodea atripinnis TaxID=208336 RepID=A0ABV0MYF9_9TELE
MIIFPTPPLELEVCVPFDTFQTPRAHPAVLSSSVSCDYCKNMLHGKNAPCLFMWGTYKFSSNMQKPEFLLQVYFTKATNLNFAKLYPEIVCVLQFKFLQIPTVFI